MRNRLKWFFYRWVRMMHPAEDFYRLKQLLSDKCFDRFLKVPENFLFKISGVNIFNKNYTKKYIPELEDKYPVLNIYVPVEYTEWRTEPKNNKNTPLRYKGNLDYRDFKTVGENKYLFELNRLHVLPILTFEYDISNTDELLEKLKSILYSWKKENPFLYSVNWKSGIEAGIRVGNLIICRLLLQSRQNADGYEFCSVLDDIIAQHYFFLKNHLSLYSSANNHLLKELFGLIIISSVYKYNNSDKELPYYFSFFQEELLKQTYDDGGSREQSVHYQAAVLNCSFLVLLFACKAGLQPTGLFRERLEKMCIFLDEMTLGGKTESLFGDKDDSNILYDVFDKDFNLYRSLLFTGQRLFRNIQYSYFVNDGDNDFINALLYEDLIMKDSPPKTNRSRSLLFPSSGYFIFKSQKSNSRLFFDVGEMGFFPLAAHGHSDALHFTLWVKENPIIVDPGVYQYNKKFIKWRNYFRGASAHNTISINNRDHATSYGVMMWGNLPKIQLCDYKIGDDYSECEGEISIRQNGKVIKHKRKIIMEGNQFLLRDTLSARDRFQITYSLHFHPLVKIALDNNIAKVTREDIEIEIKNDFFTKATIYNGNEDKKIAGWYSFKYDVKEPTVTLQFSEIVEKTLEFETVISIINS